MKFHRKLTRYANLGTLSVVPTLQKWLDFIYSPCRFSPDHPRSAQTLELYQLLPRCRNCTISHIHHVGSAQIRPDHRRPWNPITCFHAAEIARFHIFTMQVQHRYSLLRCSLGTLSVVPTLQKLHDFILVHYCVASLEPYQLFPRCRNCTISYIHHAGSAQISPHQLRSSQIILNQLRSCQISPDQPRSAQSTPDHLRSPQISQDQPRSAQINLDHLKSPQIKSDQLRAA